MAKSKVSAESFLTKMNFGDADAGPPKPAAAAARPVQEARARPATQPAPGRAGLKHFGGYVDKEIVERIAILRARLGLDNSELIAKAINDLYSRESAARKFGDA